MRGGGEVLAGPSIRALFSYGSRRLASIVSRETLLMLRPQPTAVGWGLSVQIPEGGA